MKNQNLNDLFVDVLKDMYSSENQIIEAIPRLIYRAHSPALKEALTKHLKETQNQVARLEQIFSLLDLEPDDMQCVAMQGLIQEADVITDERDRSSALDAAVISSMQKIEHYEIATYQSLRNFAKNLKFEDVIGELIQETLDEELAADKKLTGIAEGSLFSCGINQAAAKAGTVSGWKGRPYCR